MQVPPITLPDAFLDTLQTVARQTWGRAAPEGNALVAAVREVSHHYNHEREGGLELGGQVPALAARLRFFLPRDMFKVWGPLAELSAAGLLPAGPTWRVLDLGAGLGTTTLGIASYAAFSGAARNLDVQAIDLDAQALGVMERLLSGPLPLPAAKVRLTRHIADFAAPLAVEGRFDLVIAGLSLNELSAPEAESEEEIEQARAERMLRWVAGAAERLTPTGALVIIEPALRTTSRVLQRVRDRLEAADAGPFVFAPCLGITRCPLLARERDWCHASFPFDYPEALKALAKASGLRQSDPTFSYLTLRPRQGNLSTLAMAGLAPARVVGGPIRTKGKLELDLCGQREFTRLVSLDRHRDKRSDRLATVTRGTVVTLPEQVLAAEKRPLRLPKDILPEPLT